MKLKRLASRLFKTTLVLGMLIQSGISDYIASVIGGYIRENYTAKAAIQIGTSGTLTAGAGGTAARSGIYTPSYENPPFRVSLYRSKRVELAPENGLVKIWNNVSMGFPENLKASIHFLPWQYSDVTEKAPFTVGKGNTSNNTISMVADQNEVDNVRGMYGERSGSVYYNAIMQNYDNLKTNWKTLINDYNGSMGAWSYILQQDNGAYHIDTRINECFNPDGLDFNNSKDWTPEQQKSGWAHYLDMLMSLYTISTGTTKLEYEKAINDYIRNENLKESPISIVIDTEALISINGQSQFTLLPSIDFLNFYAGVSSNYAINTENWLSNPENKKYQGDTYGAILNSVQRSVDSNSILPRISSYRTAADCQALGGFCWGEAVLHKDFLLTSGNVARWAGGNATGVKYLEILKFQTPGTAQSLGYILSPAPKITTVDLPLKLEALPDEKIVRTKNIGLPVDLRIYSDLTPDKLGTWENVIENARTNGLNFDMTIQMERKDSTTTGITPSYTPDISKITKTPDQFLEFITGREDIVFNDISTDGVEIEGKDRIQFDYTAHIVITCGKDTWKGDPSDPASFKHLGEKIGYTSKPEAYSELKNYGTGSNQTGTLKEDWEAMAGVPSTEQLYFAAGGSEFIVDITLEYVKDEVAKRTYDAYYTQVNCEHYQGDAHKTQYAPAPEGASSSSLAANTHTGQSPRATWKGKIPNQNKGGESGTGDVSCPAAPDFTDYEEALAQANAWANAVNNWYIDLTASSDGQNRKWNGWNATVSPSPNPPRDENKSKYHQECSGSGKDRVCVTVPDPVSCKYSPDGSYTITVTTTIIPHVVCGPCCMHTLPEVHDTWAQTFKYDSMKIVDVHVWKINQGAVDGLTDIIAADVVGADIKKGEPNIFYNIALKNDKNMVKQDGKGGATGTSKAGRVRYSVDPKQHDEVTYKMGARTNKCDGLATTKTGNVSPAGGGGHSEKWATGFIYESFNPGSSETGAAKRPSGQQNYPTNVVNFLVNNTDAKDKATTEYKGFFDKRNQKNQATMITDFLILQTSNGDQSVMYFDKGAPAEVTTETEIPQLVVSKEEMWDNNQGSASDWSEDHINVGSYNGKYATPASKFKVKNNGKEVKTFFEPDPAGTIKKPTKPKGLMLYEGELNIILDDTNRSYITGEAEVFWKNELHWVDSASQSFNGITDAMATAPFSTSDKVGKLTTFNFNQKAGDSGYIQEAPYSKEHDKINDIIVHDPVSTENTAIISLPEERDQRTGEILGGAADIIDELNKNTGCTGDPGTCDFRHLNCKYFEDVLVADFDFDTLSDNGNPVNKVTGNSIKLTDGFTANRGELQAHGLRWGIPFSEMGISYNASQTLRIEMDLKTTTTTSTMLASFYQYDVYLIGGKALSFNTGYGYQREILLERPINDGQWHHLVFDLNMADMKNDRAFIDGKEAKYKLHLDTNGKEKPTEIPPSYVGNYLYIGCWKVNNKYPADFEVDNLKVTKLAGSKEHNSTCYKIAMMHPNGLNYHTHSQDCLGDFGKDYNYTGGVQKVTLQPGEYKVELWGASGGGNTDTSLGSSKGLGGYTSGTIKVNTTTNYYLYIGGQGTASSGLGTGGGFNGGGHGGMHDNGAKGFGGGGMTHFTTASNDVIKSQYKQIQTSIPTTYSSTSSFNGKTESSWADPNNKWTTVREFKLTKSGTVSIESTSYTVDPVCRILVNGVVKVTDDDGGSGVNFYASVNANAGDTVSLQISSYRTDGGSCNWTMRNPGAAELSYQWQDTVTFDTNKVLLVAGGGGGADDAISTGAGQDNDGTGGHGGGSTGGNALADGKPVAGTGGTQTRGYKHGLGQSGTIASDTGGAGGGWYGGKATNNNDGGGGGGSGYIRGVKNGTTISGVNNGHGKARITPLKGGGEVINGILDGKYTDKELQEILGNKVFNQIKNNMNGSLIHTWSGWTTANMMGFYADGTATASASGNNLVINSTGGDPMVFVPVDIEAKSIRKITVTLDNPTSSTKAQLFWEGSIGGATEAYSIIVPMKANTNNQTIEFKVHGKNGWTGNINKLRFDIGDRAGNYTIRNIKLYGTGTKKSSGSGTGKVYTFNYTGSSQSVSLPAGSYKLEVWGAEGGTSGRGGYGGYSSGNIDITSPRTLYIAVGGQTGFNGGGTSPGGDDYRGGGATHIAYMNNTLDRLVSNKDQVLIVAGGGGGWGGISRDSAGGGAGGGTTGGDGKEGYNTRKPGTGGTQSRGGFGGSGRSNGSDGKFGIGGNAYGGSRTGGGGGGGGYYGGGAGGTDYANFNDLDDGDGGGGSGYIGGVKNGTMKNGVQSGNGKAVITSLHSPIVISGDNTALLDRNSIINTIKNNWKDIPYWKGNKDGVKNPIWKCDYLPLNTHKCDNACYEKELLQCSEPHHKNMHYDPSNKMCWEACNDDEAHKKYKEEINTADGTFTPGNFINIDYAFEIYFPNIGDFDDGEPYGIGGLTSQRGLGFVDELDTTKWTRRKRVKFEWSVIYEGELYLPNEWITLADRGEYTGVDGEVYDEKLWTKYGTAEFDRIAQEKYTFYAVLANYEAKSAHATFEVEAVNCPGPNDNPHKPTNKKRASTFTALHGGTNDAYVDVVGRIGNLILEDVGDYRYSNLFKTPIDTSNDELDKHKTEFDETNGLLGIGGAESLDGGYKATQSGQGAGVTNFEVKQGQYRVEVYGKSLGNGQLHIEDDLGDDWVKGDYVTTSSIGQQLMVFYIDSPINTFLNLSYTTKTNSYMQIDKIVITQIGDVNEGWIVDGIVRKVDPSKQNYYLTWTHDIRGLEISDETKYINTYGTRVWLNGKTDEHQIQLPLSPEKNNIEILRQDPMLVGYDLYLDIGTIGNYYRNGASELQVIPYYYALDVTTKTIVPLDVYIKADEIYQPVNIYNLVHEEKDENGKPISGEQQIKDAGIYEYSLDLDWLAESVRRNYTDVEKFQTDSLWQISNKTNTGDLDFDGTGGAANGVTGPPLDITKGLYIPAGQYYSLGWAQFMRQDGHSRTFIGGETTYGVLKNLGGDNTIEKDPDTGRLYNPDGRIPDNEWWQAAQRWHMKMGLPSSSVFVRHGVTPDAETIKEFSNGKYVILATANITSVGDTFALKYGHPNNNGSIRVMMSNGVWSDEIKLPTDIPPVIAVYSTSKTSVIDVDIVGTH